MNKKDSASVYNPDAEQPEPEAIEVDELLAEDIANVNHKECMELNDIGGGDSDYESDFEQDIIAVCADLSDDEMEL